MTVLWLLASQAQAYCRLTTENPKPGRDCVQDGIPLEWMQQCISYSPVERSASPPDRQELLDTIDASFQTWQAVECDGTAVGIELMRTPEASRCDVPQHAPEGGNVHSVIFVQDWNERGLPADAFGLTLVWHDKATGQILDADMQVNETMGELAICDTRCDAGKVDIQNVVTHEAGHFLGLGHSFSLTSSMYFEARAGETRKRFLNEDDMAGLCAIYGHFPRSACAAEDFAPRGGLSLECAGEGGCSVATSASHGRGSGALLPAALALLWLRRRR